jgi:hypothetical protein
VRFAEGAAPWKLTWQTAALADTGSVSANGEVPLAGPACHYDTWAKEFAHFDPLEYLLQA